VEIWNVTRPLRTGDVQKGRAALGILACARMTIRAAISFRASTIGRVLQVFVSPETDCHFGGISFPIIRIRVKLQAVPVVDVWTYGFVKS
jgi:hypothetical protein